MKKLFAAICSGAMLFSGFSFASCAEAAIEPVSADALGIGDHYEFSLVFDKFSSFKTFYKAFSAKNSVYLAFAPDLDDFTILFDGEEETFDTVEYKISFSGTDSEIAKQAKEICENNDYRREFTNFGSFKVTFRFYKEHEYAFSETEYHFEFKDYCIEGELFSFDTAVSLGKRFSLKDNLVEIESRDYAEGHWSGALPDYPVEIPDIPDTGHTESHDVVYNGEKLMTFEIYSTQTMFEELWQCFEKGLTRL